MILKGKSLLVGHSSSLLTTELCKMSVFAEGMIRW